MASGGQPPQPPPGPPPPADWPPNWPTPDQFHGVFYYHNGRHHVHANTKYTNLTPAIYKEIMATGVQGAGGVGPAAQGLQAGAQVPNGPPAGAPAVPVLVIQPGVPIPAKGPGVPVPAKGPGVPVPAKGPGVPVPAQGPGVPVPAQGSSAAPAAAPSTRGRGGRGRAAAPPPEPPVVTTTTRSGRPVRKPDRYCPPNFKK